VVPFLDRAVIFLSATHIKAVSEAQAGHEADNEINK
jgi:hypothetical protein